MTFYQNFLLLFNATINKTALLNGERSRINVGRKGINQKLYVCVCILSHVKLFVTPWNIACRASLSMGLSWQEYWSGLHFPIQGIFLTQGSILCLLHLLYWEVDVSPLWHLESPNQKSLGTRHCLLFPSSSEGEKLA